MYGLMVIALNVGYVIASIIAGFFLSKLLQRYSPFKKFPKALLTTLVILAIALAPFYDILIQKGIKTYYETFKMKEQIFAYPEKDSEGRVESLGVDRDYMTESAGYLSTQKDFSHFKKAYKVRDFIEVYMNDSFSIKDGKVIQNFKNDIGYTRIHLNKSNIEYEKIDGIKDFKARYQVITKIKEHYFYIEKLISFWDKKKNTLLAKGLEVDFPVKDEESKFRYRFLHWHGANGIGVNILRLRNQHNIFEKLFNFSRNFSRI